MNKLLRDSLLQGAKKRMIFILLIGLLACLLMIINPGASTSPPPTAAQTINLSTLSSPSVFTPAQAAPQMRLALLDDDMVEIALALGFSKQIVVAPENEGLKPALVYQQGVTAEAMAAQQPQIVIGSNPGDSRSAMQRLAGYNIRTELIDRSLPAPEKIRRFGALVNMPDDADALARKIEQDYAQVSSRPALQPKPRVIFLSTRGGGAGRIAAAGLGTSTDRLLSRVGATNVIAEAGLKSFRSLSTEALIAAAPEVVIVTDDELETLGGEQGIWNKVAGLGQTPAAQKRHLIIMRSKHIHNDAVDSGLATIALRDALEKLQ